VDADGLKLIALVALGCAAGSVLRYLVAEHFARADFPWATFIVNIVGSFLLALLFFHASASGGVAPETRAILFVGFFGGFTTMSSFSLDTVALMEAERWSAAFGNIALNAGLCLAGAAAGRWAGLILAGH